MKKRVALLLSVSMLAGSFYVPVFAEPEETTDVVEIMDEAEYETEAAEVQEEDVQEIELLGAEDEETGSNDLQAADEKEESLSEAGQEEAVLGEPEETSVAFNVYEQVIAIGRMNTIIVYNDHSKPIYAAAVDPDDFQAGVSDNTIKGSEIGAESRGVLTKASRTDDSQKDIEYNKGYYVFASLSENIVLRQENLVYGDLEDPLVYTDEKNFKEVAVPADAASLMDGAKIGLSAIVQKNNTVKFKWSNKAESKKYKTFELSQLKSDGTWNMIMPASPKKGFVQGVENFQKFDDQYVEVYKLACTDESGKVDNYVTAAAPMIYYAESGETENSMDIAFTKVTPSNILGYDLEVSPDKNFSNSRIDHEDSINYRSIEYTIKKKLTAQAARADFYADGFALTTGSTYYCRVKTTISMGSVSVCSAPSPVKAVKQGPAKCDLLGIIGLSPEGNASMEDSWEATVSQSYAIFTGPDPSKVKSYELVVSDTPYGQYKVYKKIPVSAVKPYNPPQFSEFEEDDFKPENPFYYFVINDLPPMMRYYAVRAVSVTGNARGGFADGVTAAGQYTKVQDVQVTDSDVSSITLSFKGESGVKEYWIYRSTVSADLAKDMPSSLYVGKVSNKFKKPGQSGTLVFKDKKGLTKNTVYYYTVRPVYSKKFADEQKFDFVYDDANRKYINGYGETLSDPVSGKPSLDNAVVKNVKATVLSVKDVQLTWSSVKGATKYTVYYIEGSSVDNITSLTKLTSVEKGSSEFNSRKVKVQVPKVGQKYMFVINVGDEAVDSQYGSVTEPVSTHPANPTNLKTDYYKYGNRAAKLSWTNPSADREYRGNIWYDIEYKDGDGAWKELYRVSATASSYTDTRSLERGIQRHYRMNAVYIKDDVIAFNPKITSSVKYCKPYRIAVTNSSRDSIGSITIDEGETYTFRVYFYDRYGDDDMVTDKKLEVLKSSDSNVAAISSSGKDGNYVTVKVSAKATGNATLTIGARDYDDDSNRLLKKIQVRVRRTTK